MRGILNSFAEGCARGFGAHLLRLALHGRKEWPTAKSGIRVELFRNIKARRFCWRETLAAARQREHAPWALTDYGCKVVIAPASPTFFYGNSFNNQLLPVSLSDAQIR